MIGQKKDYDLLILIWYRLTYFVDHTMNNDQFDQFFDFKFIFALLRHLVAIFKYFFYLGQLAGRMKFTMRLKIV